MMAHVHSVPKISSVSQVSCGVTGSPQETHPHLTPTGAANSFSHPQGAHMQPSSSAAQQSGYCSSNMKIVPEGQNLHKNEDLSPFRERRENMFEMFRTYDGIEEYTVYVREDDGKKFYVDWEEQVSGTISVICRVN